MREETGAFDGGPAVGVDLAASKSRICLTRTFEILGEVGRLQPGSSARAPARGYYGLASLAL